MAFSLAARYAYIMKNPFKGVKKVKVPKKLKKYLNKKQSDELLQLISNTSSYAHVLIALSTGARAEEIVKLKWEDIKTTLIYAHLAPDNKFEAINVLDKFLPEQDKSVTVFLPIETKKAQL